MRFILPIILIGIAVAGFFLYLNPWYMQIKEQKAVIASYDTALDNSKALDAQREMLSKKYNSISTDDIKKLSVLLPDSVDNIRLILEIGDLAFPYGMVLKDIKYSAISKSSTDTKALQAAKQERKDYGDFDLEFSTQGTYQNFVNFLKDLEHNLRIVDISSIEFSSEAGGVSLVGAPTNIYKYNIKLKTYWLKN